MFSDILLKGHHTYTSCSLKIQKKTTTTTKDTVLQVKLHTAPGRVGVSQPSVSLDWEEWHSPLRFASRLLVSVISHVQHDDAPKQALVIPEHQEGLH